MPLAPKIDGINYFMSTERPDIACFTETWLKDSRDDNVINISDYSVVRKDRLHAQHGGTCMYIKNGLKFSRLNEYEKNTSDPMVYTSNSPITARHIMPYYSGRLSSANFRRQIFE